MRIQRIAEWNRERLIYLAVGVIICGAAVIMMIQS